MKPSDANLELTISNLANARVKLKFDNSVLVQISLSSLYSNFMFNLEIVCEWNTWAGNPAKNFTLKKLFIWYIQISKKCNKKEIYLQWSRNSIWWRKFMGVLVMTLLEMLWFLLLIIVNLLILIIKKKTFFIRWRIYSRH